MNYARIALAGLVGTIVYFSVGFLVFGKMIGKYYAPYTAVYRSAADVQAHAPVGVAATLLAILVLAAIYAVGYKGGFGAAEGFRFGLLVGLFFACAVVGDEYVTLNIGRELAVAMVIGRLVGWTIVGTAIGLVYKPARQT